MAQRIEQTGAELELGYWGIRGLAQPIRFLLAASGVPFSEIRFGVNESGRLLSKDDEGIDWQNHRSTLDLPFPNIPFLIDSNKTPNIEITQSNAILKYLARRFDFYGENERERVEIDVLQEEAYDFRNKIVKTAYTLGDDYADAYKNFTDVDIPRYLDGFDRYLKNKGSIKFFVGERTSLVDFVLYELIWQASHMVPGSVTRSFRSQLHGFILSFEKQPKIAAYMASSDYLKSPINSPWASYT